MIKETGEILDELMQLRANGLPLGVKQGFGIIDEKLRLIPGSTTDLIAYPFHGKSIIFKEWVLNMAVNAKWKWLLHTPDDGEDALIISNFITALSGKSFYKNSPNRITDKEINIHGSLLLNQLHWVSDEKYVKPMDLYNYAAEGKYNGLGIDSWNKLAHEKWIGDSAYVGEILTARNRIMRKSKCHCITVMHPKSPEAGSLRDGIKPPTVYQMYGGSEVNANANNIVIIFKPDREAYDEPYDLNFVKIKPKSGGEAGEIKVRYDYKNQRIYDVFSVSGRKDYATGAKPYLGDIVEDKPELPMYEPNEDPF